MGRKVECIHKRLYDGVFCIECGGTATERHHVIEGKNRGNSERWGLTIMMCHKCHDKLHFDPKESGMAEKYKKMAQMAFEYEFDHEKWMTIFGRNYI